MKNGSKTAPVPPTEIGKNKHTAALSTSENTLQMIISRKLFFNNRKYQNIIKK